MSIPQHKSTWNNLLFVTLLLIALLLSSCQLKQTPVEDTKNYTQATLHIAVFDIKGHSTYYEAGKDPILSKLHPIESRILKFLENYPNVKVYFRSVNRDPRVQRMFEFDSELPDIIEINPNHARYLIQDRLVDLDVYYDDEMRLWESYNRIIDSTRIDSKMLLLPVRSEPLIANYNRAIFEKLGIPPPSDNWTWDEFESIAYQLQQQGYTPTIQRSFNAIEPIIRAFGGEYVGRQPGEVNGYLNSPATIAAFEKLFKIPLKFEHFYRKGETSIFIATPSTLDLDDGDTEFTAIALPRASDGSAHNTTFTTGLAISKTTEHPDIAWELIRAIVGDSDEEAMQFVAYNSFYCFSYKLPKVSGDKYDQLYKGHLSSKPSTFFTGLHPFLVAGNGSFADFGVGQDALKEMLNGADVADTLGKYAQIIEEGIPQIFMK